MRRRFSLLRPSSRLLLAALCCWLLISITGPQSAGKSSYTIKSTPSWVRALELDPDTKTVPGSASTTFLMDDHQTRVSQRTVERYYHHVQKIETAAGLSDVSQLKLYFEPSYQQLAIHFVRIRREGAIIEAMKPSEIRIIQQEEDLNQQLYNGTLAALIFVNDLRVGDTLDYAYTVTGENPVLGGLFADKFYLADSQPIKHVKFRLLWPSARTVGIRNANLNLEPIVQTNGDETEYTWERRDVPAVSEEDNTPDWFDPYPTVSLSEFRSWGDVVQWGLPMYASTDASPEIISKVRKWENDFESPEQRTVAALRFVQDEIRYLGIELGRYSHQPTQPAIVFARRFGDCKDKSLLLTTILTSMGVDAAPALVHSSAGKSLDAEQSSPFAFDHVIVEAKIAGKTYWLDPTISYQRGGLEKYYPPPYERALVLRRGAGELEKIPLPGVNDGSISVKEKYEGASSRGPISLQVTTNYVGDEADGMRQYLADYSLTELGKSYLDFYGEANPGISALGLPEIDDDQTANRMEIKEKYLINEFWKDNKHYFQAEKIAEEARVPRVTQRSMPLRLTYPRSISETIEINLSESYNIAEDRGTISNDAVRFDYNYSTVGTNLKLEYSLKTLKDSVSVDRVPQHLLVLDKIRNYSGYELSNGPAAVVRLSSARSGGNLPLILSLIIGVPLIVIISVYLMRGHRGGQEKNPFTNQSKAKAGLSPETAIRVSSEATIDSALREMKCTCGGNIYGDGSSSHTEAFIYDGRRLIGVRLQCATCLKNSDLYFYPASNDSRDTPSLQEI